MRLFVGCLIGILFWSLAAAGLAAPEAMTMNWGGELRSYWLFKPEGLDKSKLAPLVIILHGSAGSGEDMIKVTQQGFEKIADREKFVVVYPDALERRWNDQGDGVDDVGFLLALVDKLSAEALVDKNRVYLAGISNGGMMAQRMACEQADRVAGIATVAGTMPEKLATVCKPSRPLPVLIIHGTEDPIVPWAGGAVAGFEDFGTVLSAQATVRLWAERNQCRGAAIVVQEPDRVPSDGTRVRREQFADCSALGSVTLVGVEGGGHTWPGGYQYLPERFIGKTSQDIDANSLIWNFFRQK
jgi:polyhydroxybutyrate depolymerase